MNVAKELRRNKNWNKLTDDEKIAKVRESQGIFMRELRPTEEFLRLKYEARPH